jgi:hypothetical protein
MPKISIVVPIHATMKHGDYFLWRLIQSVMTQTFKDYEIVIVQEGKMAENTNKGMRKARGEIIKILYLDDYLAHNKALQVIVDNFKAEDMWLATGCLHARSGEWYETPHSPHYPKYVEDIHAGNNQIGSPSVVAVRNEGSLLFDENLSFLLDCDLYKRYYMNYGAPKLIRDLNVVIGIHDGQTSVTMHDEEKMKEFTYMKQKYG